MLRRFCFVRPLFFAHSYGPWGNRSMEHMHYFLEEDASTSPEGGEHVPGQELHGAEDLLVFETAEVGDG